MAWWDCLRGKQSSPRALPDHYAADERRVLLGAAEHIKSARNVLEEELAVTMSLTAAIVALSAQLRRSRS